jgi:hypothetical protein
MRKKLTFEIEDFIEDIALMYGLDDAFIEEDPLLKETLGPITDPAERITIKLLYSKRIEECLKAKQPLETFVPSAMLGRIIENLINKDISIEELKEAIENRLRLPPSSAREIAQKISENEKVLEAIDAAFIAKDNPEVEVLKEKISSTGINQELF